MPNTTNTGRGAVAVDNSAFGGPNAQQATNANVQISAPQNVPAPNTPLPTGAITSASIAPASPTTVTQPNPPAPYNTSGLNSTGLSSVATPPLTATPQETQQSDLQKRIQDLNTQDSGKAAFETQQYNNLGFGMTYDSSGNIMPDAGTADLSAKLSGLKNEALAIPLQVQNRATGTNDTGGGLAPVQTDALRNNAIASLQVSSTIDAINGNLVTAQAKVNQAVIQKFGPIEAQISALTKNLQSIKDDPATALADKNRAQAQLDSVNAQTAKIQQQKDDFKTGQALALAAATKNPTDKAALLASSQAMELDPSDPQYLQKVAALVGQYQTDEVQTKLDNQLKTAQIGEANASTANSNASAAKTRAETNALTNPGSAGGLSTDSSNFYAQLASTGVNLNSMLPSLGMGAAAVATKTALLNQIATNATKLGIDGGTFGAMLTDSQAKNKAYTALQKTGSMLTANEDKTNSDFQLLKQLGAKMDASSLQLAVPALNSWLKTGQVALTGNADVNNYVGLLTTTMTNYAKVVNSQTSAGGVSVSANNEVQGLLSKGLSTATINNYIDSVATPEMKNTTTSYDTALKGLFGDIASVTDTSGGLGGSGSDTSTTVTSNGQQYQVGAVYNDGTANWTVDAKGNWTKQ